MGDQEQCHPEHQVAGPVQGQEEEPPPRKDLEQCQISNSQMEAPKNDPGKAVVEAVKVDSSMEGVKEAPQVQCPMGGPEHRHVAAPAEGREEGESVATGGASAGRQRRICGPHRPGMRHRYLLAVRDVAYANATDTAKNAALFALVPPLLVVLKVEDSVSATAILAYFAILPVLGLVTTWITLVHAG